MPTTILRLSAWHHRVKVVGLLTCLVSVVSCASAGSPLSASLDPSGFDRNDSSLPAQKETRPTHEHSNLYHEMLQQGNYSDAAILQSLQELTPRSTNITPRFEDLAGQANQLPLPDLSYSASTTTSTLGAGWHTQVGWTLILDGNHAAAEAAYRQALRHETESAEAYLGLGMALMFQGKREQAIRAYEEALKIQPSYAAALVHLGYAYADSSDNQPDHQIKARSLFQQASDLGDPFGQLALKGLKELEEGI